MLQLLKDSNADFNAKDDRGQGFLHLVCEHGCEIHSMELLMDESFDVNVTNLMGETPLHYAAMAFKDYYVKALIEHGAKVDVKDDNGKTPLHLALISPGVARLLLEAGADVNAKDNLGKTPLHCARSVAVVKVLISFGALVDVLDVNGCSPLYDLLTHFGNHEAVLSEMLKYGADIQDPKIYELLQTSHIKYGKNGRLYLKQHFIKLIAIAKHVEVPFATDEITDPNNPFLKGCQKEVELLKNYFINDCTSLYCLLHKNRDLRCAYLNNEELKNLVEDAAIEQKFPNYSVLILGCYNEAARRGPLLKSVADILIEVNEIFLPDLCIDKILIFLSTIDLLHFVQAFENVHLNSLSKSIGKIIV